MNPSSLAWDKIDAAISKKNKGLIWVRVAAILLIGVFLGALLWFQFDKTNPATDSLTQTKTINKSKQAIKETEPILSQENNEASSIDSKQDRIKVKRKLKYIEQAKDGLPKEEVSVAVLTQQPDESIVIPQRILVTEKITTHKPIVLEYRLDNIEPSTPEDEKVEFASIEPKSGLKKAIDYAIGVKNGDSTLFNIRQAKETLFALNFKKDKKNITNQ